MNETGPITEDLFEANRMIENLKSFMKKEGYTQDEINKIMNKIKNNNNYLLNKVIVRMQLPPEKKVLITCIEHWKMWLKFRKLMRDKLRFANNSITPVICDIQWAFNKWHNGDKKFA